MALKENINKIHSDLLDSFENISISENSSLKFGNYIELSIIESNKKVSAIIRKTDLESSNFNWVYKSNPLKQDSHLVERHSNVESFTNDIKDIFEKNRFDSEYTEKI